MLKLTQITNHGLLLLEHIATQRSSCSFSARDLALQLGLPLTTTAKILKSLSKNGLLISQRGAQGGYQLAKNPLEISLAEIVLALEGSSFQAKLGLTHPASWVSANIERLLKDMTLEELAKNRPAYPTGSPKKEDK
ncbi:MAG: Rrf2 family transcriptional regulator [Myxococcota bacterium]|nr:Rrf2 family transcriptional regulator [Myxococcota bacterium]